MIKYWRTSALFYRDERNVLSCDLKSAIRQLKESD